ncbi:MAG TPA: hypothetical protein PK445_08455, partial [Methanolinea sp.]|nr:hypothetical protein [Methanolinea sp.]HQE85762.1 hypothetical protein [Methanolinea sp.]
MNTIVESPVAVRMIRYCPPAALPGSRPFPLAGRMLRIGHDGSTGSRPSRLPSHGVRSVGDEGEREEHDLERDE